MSNLGIVLLIILLLALLGVLPVWSHAATWGPYPASGAGVLFVVLLIFVLFGII